MFLEDSKLPKASTCGLCLFLPLKASSYEEFKVNSVEGVVSGYGFGNMQLVSIPSFLLTQLVYMSPVSNWLSQIVIINVLVIIYYFIPYIIP